MSPRGLRRSSVSLTVLALLVPVGISAGGMDAAGRETETRTVAVAADSYTRRDAPDSNFGGADGWSVDGRLSVRRHAFLKFRVPTPPDGLRYTGVRLRVWSSDTEAPAGRVGVYAAGNRWRESGLTWNTQPDRGRRIDGAGSAGGAGWIGFDVGAAVPASGGTVSLRLEGRDVGRVPFEARESAGTRHARLVLRLASTSTQASTAAKRHGWGAPVAGDEFGYTGAPNPRKWSVYDSRGHAGNGLRVPRAWHVDGRVARVTGDADGTTGGMSARFGRRKYGRWEARMRTNARDPEYHPVLILWPDSGNWPCDGEIDYAEGTDDVGRMSFFHHYSCDNRQTQASRRLDATRWHHYAVEWTSDAIVGYLDGVEWFRDEVASHQPPGSMHQTVQLDWFPDGTRTRVSWMEVDWVRVYDLG